MKNKSRRRLRKQIGGVITVENIRKTITDKTTEAFTDKRDIIHSFLKNTVHNLFFSKVESSNKIIDALIKLTKIHEHLNEKELDKKRKLYEESFYKEKKLLEEEKESLEEEKKLLKNEEKESDLLKKEIDLLKKEDEFFEKDDKILTLFKLILSNKKPSSPSNGGAGAFPLNLNSLPSGGISSALDIQSMKAKIETRLNKPSKVDIVDKFRQDICKDVLNKIFFDSEKKKYQFKISEIIQKDALIFVESDLKKKKNGVINTFLMRIQEYIIEYMSEVIINGQIQSSENFLEKYIIKYIPRPKNSDKFMEIPIRKESKSFAINNLYKSILFFLLLEDLKQVGGDIDSNIEYVKFSSRKEIDEIIDDVKKIKFNVKGQTGGLKMPNMSGLKMPNMSGLNTKDLTGIVPGANSTSGSVSTSGKNGSLPVSGIPECVPPQISIVNDASNEINENQYIFINIFLQKIKKDIFDEDANFCDKIKNYYIQIFKIIFDTKINDEEFSVSLLKNVKKRIYNKLMQSERRKMVGKSPSEIIEYYKKIFTIFADDCLSDFEYIPGDNSYTYKIK